MLTQNIAAGKIIVSKRNQLHKIFASKFYNCLQLVSRQTSQHILSSMASCFSFFTTFLLTRNKFPRSILLMLFDVGYVESDSNKVRKISLVYIKTENLY